MTATVRCSNVENGQHRQAELVMGQSEEGYFDRTQPTVCDRSRQHHLLLLRNVYVFVCVCGVCHRSCQAWLIDMLLVILLPPRYLFSSV